MNKRITAIIALLCLTLTFALSGCASTPETPIIKNKDIDNMLNAANGEGSGMSELKGTHERYTLSLNDESFNISVTADADVLIPDAEKMSVIRVKQCPFTQETLDKIKRELVGDTKLYDGSALRTMTKKSIKAEIELLENEIAELHALHPDEEQSGLEESLRELRERYKNAPEKPEVTKKPSDGKLHSVSEMYGKNKSSDYYSWLYEMNPDGEVFYGVSDGENGEYLSLSVNNSETHSNFLSFRKSFHGYEDTSGLTPSNELDAFHFDGGTVPANYAGEFIQLPEDTVTLSREDALKTAQSFMQGTGLASNFTMTGCAVYTEVAAMRYATDISEGMPCRSYYVIRFSRLVNGAAVTESGDVKYAESFDGDSFSKLSWPRESIVFRINDRGIVGFDYVSPIELLDTVVDSAALKPFPEIKSYFEKMVVIANADKDKHVDININRVEFGYVRISEKDNFDTGLLVPAWAFYGLNSNAISFDKSDPEKTAQNIMTINAIDGTIIDQSLGY